MTNTTTQFRDRVAIQDNSISPINSIRTLYKKGSSTINCMTLGDDFYISNIIIPDVMFYTSFGIKYENIKKRIGARFIEGDKLDDTRDDYCNKESWEHPIITMFADANNKEYVEIYTDNTTKIPATLEVSYIELPAIVKWDVLPINSVDCNLPIYEHNEIIEMAVDKFFKSVSSTTKPVTRN